MRPTRNWPLALRLAALFTTLSHLFLCVFPLPAAAHTGLTADASEQQLSPCTDPTYLELKQKKLADLTDREYEYFLLKDKQCWEYQLAISETLGRSAGFAMNAGQSAVAAAKHVSLLLRTGELVQNVRMVALSDSTIMIKRSPHGAVSIYSLDDTVPRIAIKNVVLDDQYVEVDSKGRFGTPQPLKVAKRARYTALGLGFATLGFIVGAIELTRWGDEGRHYGEDAGPRLLVAVESFSLAFVGLMLATSQPTEKTLPDGTVVSR
jgi:hypothetical protein